MTERKFRIVVYLMALVPVVYVVSMSDAPFWVGIPAWVSAWTLVWLILTEITGE
jgi:hypothetical protein